MPGDADPIYRASRRALLDVIDALGGHRAAVVLVGAHAVYLHTGDADVALAEFTKDADIALDPRILSDEPLIETAMAQAGFNRPGQPGIWLNSEAAQVDLLVPENLAGSGGTRSVTAPPHDRRAMRRVRGLEAALVDNAEHNLSALEPDDHRTARILVAEPAALIVSKAHKLYERHRGRRGVAPKDAHDVYRLLVATETQALARTIRLLLADPLAGTVTREALGYLSELFATPDSVGSRLAGQAENEIGEPDTVAVASSALIGALLNALE